MAGPDCWSSRTPAVAAAPARCAQAGVGPRSNYQAKPKLLSCSRRDARGQENATQGNATGATNEKAAHLGSGGPDGTTDMNRIILALTLSLYAASALAAGSSCKEQATEKRLAGAALTSFMNKCQRDAQTSCNTSATEKKLAGAAKTSFTNKCVADAVGK